MRPTRLLSSLLAGLLAMFTATGIATAQTPPGPPPLHEAPDEGLKRVIGNLTPLWSRTKPALSEVGAGSELRQRVVGLLADPRLAGAISGLQARGLTADPTEAAVLDYTVGQAFALPLRNAAGRYITNTNGENILSLLILTDHGLALEVEGAVDQASGRTSRLTFRDPAGRDGLEFNYRDAKVYQLGSAEALPKAASGTVACVREALGDLAKPCEASFLGVGFAVCIDAIAALPVTVGISAIVALPACAGVIGDLLKAVLCAGIDCGLATVCTVPPAAPSGLAANISGSSLTLAWIAPTGPVDSYVIEVGRSSGASDFATVNTGDAATSIGPVSISTVPPGRYFVRTRAKNACGTSGPSNEVIVQVGSIDVTAFWSGTFSDTDGNGTITLTLFQDVSNVTGSALLLFAGQSQARLSGLFSGTLSQIAPGEATLTWSVSYNLILAGNVCPGRFGGSATVTNTTLTGTYSGVDCNHSFTNGVLSVTKQ